MKKGEDFKIQVWKNQQICEMIKFGELEKNNYEILFELYPSELIELENKKGHKIKCKVVGFSGGQIEVKSILGDSTDLIRNGVFNNIISRYLITISTIKNIRKVKYNILGDKVCHSGKY